MITTYYNIDWGITTTQQLHGIAILLWVADDVFFLFHQFFDIVFPRCCESTSEECGGLPSYRGLMVDLQECLMHFIYVHNIIQLNSIICWPCCKHHMLSMCQPTNISTHSHHIYIYTYVCHGQRFGKPRGGWSSIHVQRDLYIYICRYI